MTWLAVITFFKGIWGKIAAGAVIVGVLLIALARGIAGIKKSGRDEQKVKQLEANIEQKEAFDDRVAESIEAGNRANADARNGGLYESPGVYKDDGYKRKPSGTDSGTD